jgi:hypothetical protein
MRAQLAKSVTSSDRPRLQETCTCLLPSQPICQRLPPQFAALTYVQTLADLEAHAPGCSLQAP